jgi:hypothetical protein
MKKQLEGLANLTGSIRPWFAVAALGLLAIVRAAEAPAPAPAPAANQPGAPATPVPPPSAPAKLSAAELEKLLMPIALYPDPLLATVLPASVYPLEIVQAARFMADTNNISKVDDQPWDDSVKAVARIPAALKKLNDDLQWTIQLGEAFLNQDKDVMDTIQALRLKAQKAGTLQTSEQQIIVVTNMVTETKVEQEVVVVTNTVVQIQPSNPQTVYVPSYPPTVYYPPPAYVYNPYAPLITFTAGVAMGAIIANNCDWNHGGCYHGGGDVNINRNTNVNVDRSNNSINGGNRVNAQGGQGKKWQPDANRVRASGSPTSAKAMESRGWGSSQNGAGGARANTVSTANRGPSASARPATGGSSRPTATPAGANRAASPSAGNRPAASPSIGGGNRPSGGAASAASSAGGRSGGGSAFSGGGGGASQRAASQRGSASRGGGGRGGGGRGGGGRR